MLKKIKSLFVIEEEGAQKKPEQKQNPQPKPEKQRESAESVDPVVHIPAAEVGEGQVKDKFLNVLFAAMDKNNLEGFDYLEFKEFLRSLKKVQMDEETKFKSAFATAQTMGASVSLLKESAQHYLDILQKEEQKFNVAASNQRKKNLTSKQDEIVKLKKIIAEKTKKIEALQNEIANHRKLVETRSKEIESASVKVERTKKNFDASYNAVVGQIKEDLNKIDRYLGK